MLVGLIEPGQGTSFRSRQVKALFGAHNSYRPEQGTEVIEVVKIVPHPKYSMKIFNDIAIMKLARPVKFGPWVQPACLPSAGEKVPDGATALLSGWGRKDGNSLSFPLAAQASMKLLLIENGSSPDFLHQVTLPVMNPQECVDTFKKNQFPLVLRPEVHMCAGVADGGKDTCQVPRVQRNRRCRKEVLALL